MQPETLRIAFRTTFARAERTYGDRARNLYSVVALNIFRLGTLAMALYAFSYHHAPFALTTFGIIVLLIIAFVALKTVMSWLVSYTFELHRTTALYAPQYDNLWTVLCLLLYPITLLYINIGGVILLWLPTALTLLFIGGLAVKIWQYYYTGISSLLYLLIYIVTMELLPIGALWLTTNMLT